MSQGRHPNMSDFTDFALGISKGLVQAYQSDIDVFLLFSAGGLAATPSRPLRALGVTLGIYTTFRRMDGYVAAMTSKVHMLARVMAEQQEHPLLFHPGGQSVD